MSVLEQGSTGMTRAGRTDTTREARLVLTWADKPKDLDIYVLAPPASPGEAPCEVNWRQKDCHSNTVRLDRDDTNGHGPETISVSHLKPCFLSSCFSSFACCLVLAACQL